MKRIAIVGAGMMARMRGKAFLETGKAAICAVASTRIETAKALAGQLGAPKHFDDYRQVEAERPDAVLIEVPHNAQHDISMWALEGGFDLLIGGVLDVASKQVQALEKLAAKKARIVEAGYEARYDQVWEKARELVAGGALGKPIMAQSLALWPGNPKSWYYHQEASGGMPLTHMTYCFINPIRWILGRVRSVSAVANQVAQVGPEFVAEENCVANLHFEEAFASIAAGFVTPKGFPGWWAKIICTRGAIEVLPEERIARVYRDSPQELAFGSEPSPFVQQANAFLTALDSRRPCLNPPSDAKIDVCIAEAIVKSARAGRSIRLA